MQRPPPEAARHVRTPWLLCNVSANCEPSACRYGFPKRFRVSRTEMMEQPCLHSQLEMQTPAASLFCRDARMQPSWPPLLHHRLKRPQARCSEGSPSASSTTTPVRILDHWSVASHQRTIPGRRSPLRRPSRWRISSARAFGEDLLNRPRLAHGPGPRSVCMPPN